MTDKTNLFVTFDSRAEAEAFVRDLVGHGASDRDISLVTREIPQEEEEEEARGSEHAKRAESLQMTESAATLNAAADTMASVAGIGLGVGALAFLTGVFVPGIGLIAGGGALAAAIAAGTTSAGMKMYMEAQGLAAEEADRFTREVERGRTLVSVAVPSGDVDVALVERLRPHPSKATLL